MNCLEYPLWAYFPLQFSEPNPSKKKDRKLGIHFLKPLKYTRMVSWTHKTMLLNP